LIFTGTSLPFSLNYAIIIPNSKLFVKVKKQNVFFQKTMQKRLPDDSLFRDCVFYENECFKNEPIHFTNCNKRRILQSPLKGIPCFSHLLYHNYTIFCRCFQGLKRRFVLSKQPK